MGGNAFFSEEGVTHLLLGGYEICSPLGDQSGCSYLRAKLENPVFIQRDKNAPYEVAPCRRGVSGVLLIALNGDGFSTIGALHPEPLFPFDPKTFPPQVPFARIQPWPPVDGRIRIEWTAETHPLFTRFDLLPIANDSLDTEYSLE